jgi:hypothetical protein
MLIDPEEPTYKRQKQAFVRVMNKHYGSPRDRENYFEGSFEDYFDEVFAPRALLFALCIKELNSNASKFSEDELEMLSELSEELIPGYDFDEEQENTEGDRAAVNSCIELFDSKIKKK